MKVKLLIISLLITSVLGAQQPRRVRIGGGPGEDRAKDWPKAVARPNMTETEVVAELRRYLDALVQRDLFSGSVLLAKGNSTLFLESYGMADKEHYVPNTTDTKYNLGSINKVFTQVALLQLRDQGKIDFTKTLRTYLPDYPNALADRITIQQMMRHSSGLGDIFGPEYEAMPKEKLRTLRDYLPLFVDKPLEFEPGARTRYSNAGYILLGLVIEKLSGMSYDDYVRAKIFTPLAMNDTAAYAADAIVPKRATGYTRGEDGVLCANTYMHPARGSSAGGGYSTVNDLLKFTRGANQVLSAQAFEQMIGANPAVGWGGGAPGINAAIELGGGYTIIVLSNYSPPTASEVVKNVRQLVGIVEE
ncbi:MAG TPA: serine hydrolase domain-containing protein [Thermoanaerobaculia bacterium]|nr:serine hydrolase domain-containing protein [Thermoanaerobaculia bacterium]